MNGLRKARAIVQLAIVSAVCWGIIAALIRSGSLWLQVGQFPLWPVLWKVFVVYASLGFVAGVIFAAAIALLPPVDARKGLSARRAGSFGALGGVMVFVVAYFLVDPHGPVGAVQVMSFAGVFGLVGSTTGVAILGIARRGTAKGEIEGAMEPLHSLERPKS